MINRTLSKYLSYLQWATRSESSRDNAWVHRKCTLRLHWALYDHCSSAWDWGWHYSVSRRFPSRHWLPKPPLAPARKLAFSLGLGVPRVTAHFAHYWPQRGENILGKDHTDLQYNDKEKQEKWSAIACTVSRRQLIAATILGHLSCKSAGQTPLFQVRLRRFRCFIFID